MLETCAACGKEVGFRHTVHVVLNPGGDEGVVDHYVCRSCYEDDLAPLFAGGDDAEAEEANAAVDEGARDAGEDEADGDEDAPEDRAGVEEDA